MTKLVEISGAYLNPEQVVAVEKHGKNVHVIMTNGPIHEFVNVHINVVVEKLLGGY